MKTKLFRLLFTLGTLGIVLLSTRILSAQPPTETDERLTTLSNRIEKRATKEELGVVQHQLDELQARVDKIGEKTGNTANEMRIVEVIGAGLAFVGGIFVQKTISRLMPDK